MSGENLCELILTGAPAMSNPVQGLEVSASVNASKEAERAGDLLGERFCERVQGGRARR
jgi:hypothetical protein